MVIPPAFVADTSFVMPWAFIDEDNEVSNTARLAFKTRKTIIHVPALWLWEITNVLVIGERRGRITKDETAEFLGVIERGPVKVLPPIMNSIFSEVPDYMRAHGLSGYDAEYLSAAKKNKLPLATLDEKLKRAAVAAGIAIVGA